MKFELNDKLLTFFGFTRMPFVKEISTGDIFRTEMYDSLLGMLKFGLTTEDIMLVYGEVGCGKSVALRLFMESLDTSRYAAVYIKCGGIYPAHLYQAILLGLKIEPAFRLHTVKRQYEKYVGELSKKPVIVLDDAQDLSDEALCEIKHLVSFEADSKHQVCVVLSGQIELSEKLTFSLFSALAQRIRLQHNVQGMCLEETCKYITHQLSVCGKDQPIFSDDAVSEIFKRTQGNPRLINGECYKAIIAAFIDQRNIIEPSVLNFSVHKNKNNF